MTLLESRRMSVRLATAIGLLCAALAVVFLGIVLVAQADPVGRFERAAFKRNVPASGPVSGTLIVEAPLSRTDYMTRMLTIQHEMVAWAKSQPGNMTPQEMRAAAAYLRQIARRIDAVPAAPDAYVERSLAIAVRDHLHSTANQLTFGAETGTMQSMSYAKPIFRAALHLMTALTETEVT